MNNWFAAAVWIWKHWCTWLSCTWMLCCYTTLTWTMHLNCNECNSHSCHWFKRTKSSTLRGVRTSQGVLCVEAGKIHTWTTWWSLWSAAQEAQMPSPMQLKQNKLHSLLAETPWTAQVAKKSALSNGFNHNGPSLRLVSPSAITGPPCIDQRNHVLQLRRTFATIAYDTSTFFLLSIISSQDNATVLGD